MESSSDDGSDEIDLSRHKLTSFRCRKREVLWPPPKGSKWPDLKHVDFRKYGTKMQLFSKTGCFLAIYHTHGVKGTNDGDDLHTLLEIENAGYPGHVRIRGLASNAYVAMDKRGNLYTEFDGNEEATVFIESLQRSYNVYLSRKYAYLGWYIGLKRTGSPKRGPKTAPGQKATMFLPTRSKFDKMDDFSGDDMGFGAKMKLFSETGYNLAIRYDGLIEGSHDDNDPACCLQLISAGPGLVQIKGLESDLCVSFSEDGDLYGEQEETNDATIFHENFQGSYSAYRSKKYPEWYVGINKRGQAKKGHRTRYGQKAVKFLPRRIKC